MSIYDYIKKKKDSLFTVVFLTWCKRVRIDYYHATTK